MYKLPKTHYWHGRIDSETDRDSFRFHQAVEFMSSDEVPANAFSIIGFECEEGVRRNQGRLGAMQAPNEIRKQLANLPYHLGSQQTVDVGNVMCKGEEMERAQQELGSHIELMLKRSSTPIILGGGHETLYGHYLGVRKFIGPNAKLGLINIDAHFDMREADQPSSGTMFKQILETDTNAGYLVLGIQPYGNTRSLFNRADKLGAKYMLAEDLALWNMPETEKIIDAFCAQYDYVLVTLCTDSISATAAPGVSAPSPFGLDPVLVRQLLRSIVANEKVQSFDISEVNPSLDENGKTVKLAAYLVAEVMGSFRLGKG